jgi:probable addiction module antidote protein
VATQPARARGVRGQAIIRAIWASARRRWLRKKMAKISKFDATDYLDSQETIAAYLNEALEAAELELVYDAIHRIARAKGMTDATKEALSSNAKPKFDTVQKVIESFGLKLVVEPIEEKKGS